MKRIRAVMIAWACIIAAPAAAAEEELPFVGRWDCEVAEFTFTRSVYNNGSEDLPILEAQEGTDGSYTLFFADEDGSYTLFFADEYVITLSGFTGDEMGWYSHASGDAFTCSRIEGTAG